MRLGSSALVRLAHGVMKKWNNSYVQGRCHFQVSEIYGIELGF